MLSKKNGIIVEEEVVELFAAVEYVQYVKVTDIKWEADDMEDVKDLPTSMEVAVPLSIFEDESEDDYEYVADEFVSNYITDEVGFCHNGYSCNFDLNGFFENEFQDYMDENGNYIESEKRIGVICEEKEVLDKGICYANVPRNKWLH